MSIASWLGLFYVLSELSLAIFKRAEVTGARSADRGSLALLWIIIVASLYVAYTLPYALPGWHFGPTALFIAAGVGVFVAGIVLRWFAIVYLGRFFTVNVAIASDHRLIDGGPYRYIRHPSYTGAMMAFLGLGLCLCNWGSLLVILIPVFLVFARRIRVEEGALIAGLGDGYRSYMRRTKRLIPGIY